MTFPTTLPIGQNAPWLAPLAGYSDLSFRLLCREYGAAVACTEMISAKGILYNSQGTRALLKTYPQDSPLVVQLFGAEPDAMEHAAAWILEQGHAFLDINAGCAVPKVTKTGSGASLLRTPNDRKRLAEIVRRLTTLAGSGRVGVKMRLGWDEEVFLEMAKDLEQAGAGWLTLHPRTAKQGFAGKARWPAISELRQVVFIPVLASGDLLTAHDGKRCMDETGASGILFARGAMRRPAIFREFLGLMDEEAFEPLNPAGLATMIRRHAELAIEHGNPHTSFLKMRSFAPQYLKDLPHARDFRRRLISCKSWQELDLLLEAILGMRGGMALNNKID